MKIKRLIGMNAIRWLLALVGWVFRGPAGALIGYLVGYVIERGLYASNVSRKEEARRREYARRYQETQVSEIQSAYSVLGVSPAASVDEIKSAYRRLAMQYHPDTVASLGQEAQKMAEAKFKEIQNAYEVVKKYRNIK